MAGSVHTHAHTTHTHTHHLFTSMSVKKKKRINRRDAIPDCPEGVKYFRTQMTSPFSDMAAAMYTCFVYIYTGTHTVKGSGPQEMIKMCVRYELSIFMMDRQQEAILAADFYPESPRAAFTLIRTPACLHPLLNAFLLRMCLLVCVCSGCHPLAGISRPGITTQSLSLR